MRHGRCAVGSLSARQLAQGCGRSERGLVTLDWLLILAAVIGAAAGTAVLLQNFFEDAAEDPTDPAVRAIEAQIAATRIVKDATELFLRDRDACSMATPCGGDFSIQEDFLHTIAGLYTKTASDDFKARCHALYLTFGDVLSNTYWGAPRDPFGLGQMDDYALPVCRVEVKANLLP